MWHLPFMFTCLVQQFLQLIHKCTDILKLPVYRRKTDIGDRIQILQMIHHDLSDLCAGYLLLRRAEDLSLDRIHHTLDLPDRDRPFVAGAEHAVLDLLTVILLSGLILFDHSQRDRLHLFIGGKTFSAGIAHPAAPDRIGILHRSGIHDPCVILITIWTSHLFFSPFSFPVHILQTKKYPFPSSHPEVPLM